MKSEKSEELAVVVWELTGQDEVGSVEKAWPEATAVLASFLIVTVTVPPPEQVGNNGTAVMLKVPPDEAGVTCWTSALITEPKRRGSCRRTLHRILGKS